MNHQQALDLLPAYVDKELSLSENVDFEAHLNDCTDCQQVYDEQLNISNSIKQNALYFNAAPQFQQHVIETLTTESKPKNFSNFWSFNWINDWGSKGTLTASLALLVLSSSLLLALPTTQEKLTEALIDNHVRSLQVDHLSDVISTDKHTVKPWFLGKIDFAPPVIDLAAAGYTLDGGRLDYVDKRNVAVIIYHHDKHPINLYVWPNSEAETEVKSASKNGYHLAYWRGGGMSYWAISDLESAKLVDFANALKAEALSNH